MLTTKKWINKKKARKKRNLAKKDSKKKLGEKIVKYRKTIKIKT